MATSPSCWHGSMEHSPKPIAVGHVVALLDHGPNARVADLVASVIPGGIAGMWPEPGSMAMFWGDADFAASIQAAVSQQPTGKTCVVWSLRDSNHPIDVMRGGSMGAAFGVVLDQVRTRHKPSRRLLTPRRGRKVAVTGTLLDDGSLGLVDGIDNKLRAAASARIAVVLPSGNLPGDPSGRREVHLAETALTRQSGVPVRSASKLTDAIRKARIDRRRRFATIAVSVLLVSVMSAAAVGVAHQRTQADRSSHRAALLRKASELRALATDSTTSGLRNRQTQALLLLAARSLTAEAGDRTGADAIAATPLPVGAGVLRSVDIDAGSIVGLWAADGKLIVSTGQGHVVMVDPTTAAIEDSLVLPPGAETLNQPTISAVADHPTAQLFAAVEDTIEPRRAELVIYSATGHIVEVGRSAFAPGRVGSALGYSPDGRDVIVASGNKLLWFDVTRAIPVLQQTCISSEASQPVTILAQPNGKPAVAYSDGSLWSIEGWSHSTSSDPCALRPILPSKRAKESVAAIVGSQLEVASLDSGGRVTVSAPPSSSRVLAAHGVATALGGFDSKGLQIQTRSGASTTLQLLNPESGAVLQSYLGHGVPSITAYGSLFAASKTVVDQLSTQKITYPGAIGLQGSGLAHYQMIAGRTAVGVASDQEALVYRFDGAPQGSTLTLSADERFAGGSGRVGGSMALNDDGRLIAAITDDKAETFARDVCAFGISRRMPRSHYRLPLRRITRCTACDSFQEATISSLPTRTAMCSNSNASRTALGTPHLCTAHPRNR